MKVLSPSMEPRGTRIRRSSLPCRFAVIFLTLSFVWEVAQLPLYTLWQTGSQWEIAYAVKHCSVGDILIGASALTISVMTFGRAWLNEITARRYETFATVLLGVGYTVFSEWLNVSIWKRWDYSDLMPIAPFIGTGLSPLLQWIVIPLLTFRLTLGRISRL